MTNLRTPKATLHIWADAFQWKSFGKIKEWAEDVGKKAEEGIKC